MCSICVFNLSALWAIIFALFVSIAFYMLRELGRRLKCAFYNDCLRPAELQILSTTGLSMFLDGWRSCASWSFFGPRIILHSSHLLSLQKCTLYFLVPKTLAKNIIKKIKKLANKLVEIFLRKTSLVWPPSQVVSRISFTVETYDKK